MKLDYKKISLIGFLLLAVSCSKEQKTFESSYPSTEPEPEAPVIDVVDVENGSPLYFKLQTKWEGADAKTFETVKTCSFDPASPMPSTQTCVISVPEAKLYYSDLNFKMGSLAPASCPIVHFQPYYYLRSTDDYQPKGETAAIICSAASPPTDPKCYGGAAPAILKKLNMDFPKSTGIYFLSFNSAVSDVLLDSENTLRTYGGDPVNYLVTNDMLSTSTPNTGAETDAHRYQGDALPLATRYKDYVINCEEYWGEIIYTMRLRISDENTPTSIGGAQDQYPDWPF